MQYYFRSDQTGPGLFEFESGETDHHALAEEIGLVIHSDYTGLDDGMTFELEVEDQDHKPLFKAEVYVEFSEPNFSAVIKE